MVIIFKTMISFGEDADKLELKYTVGKNVKWYCHFGKAWQFINMLKNRNSMSWQFYSK